MWPFKKRNLNVERNPWDNLIDYIQSDDIKFDHETSTENDVNVIYEGKIIHMHLTGSYEGFNWLSLTYGNHDIGQFLGRNHGKATNKAYKKYLAECKTKLETKIICDLFNKCNES